MGRKILMYSASLIALYLAVEYYTGFSKDLSSASTGASTLVRTFQGRG